MIRKSLDILKTELATFMDKKNPDGMREVNVILSNILDQEGKLVFNEKSDGKSNHYLVITLINIEEEKHLKPRQRFKELANQQFSKQNPEVNLNLYVLFTAFSSEYETCLGIISDIIAFFQKKPYFDAENTPNLSPKIQKMIANMHSLTFEQQNYLWGLMGAKYLPSIVFKMRTISIDEEAISLIGKPVLTIDVQS